MYFSVHIHRPMYMHHNVPPWGSVEDKQRDVVEVILVPWNFYGLIIINVVSGLSGTILTYCSMLQDTKFYGI
jgi:hypothetical protein